MHGSRQSSRTKRLDTRERILDSALAVFAEKGYSAATTKEIAARAGVNEVTLFRHLKCKEGIFAAVMSERSAVQEIGKAVSLEVEGPIEEVIVKNVKMVLKVLRSNRHLLMVMMGDAWRQPKLRAVIGNSIVRRGLAHLVRSMKAQMDAGRLRKMDPEVPARALMGMVQSYFITTYLLEGERPSREQEDRLIRGFVSVFLQGMAPEVERRAR